MLPAVRARLVELIADRLPDVAVGYHPPRHHVDVTAPVGGPLEAVWLDGAASAQSAPAGIASPIPLSEDWTQTIVMQVLGRDTGDRQEVLDERCGELLGEIMAELAINPRLGGITADAWGPAVVTTQEWRWISGAMQRSSGALTMNARVELDVRVQADRS